MSPAKGGPGHSFPEPTIRFSGTQAAGFRAFAAARDYGLPVFAIRRFWPARGDELIGPDWEMTFYPLSDLMQRQREAEKAGLLEADRLPVGPRPKKR
jgi:hypothetical protein